jgi:hypothetical protein
VPLDEDKDPVKDERLVEMLDDNELNELLMAVSKSSKSDEEVQM